jgi:hypothetical protein
MRGKRLNREQNPSSEIIFTRGLGIRGHSPREDCVKEFHEEVPSLPCGEPFFRWCLYPARDLFPEFMREGICVSPK